MFAWSFAYKKSRDGMQWIQCAVDRERFKARISQIECVLKPILENKITMQIKLKYKKDKNDVDAFLKHIYRIIELQLNILHMLNSYRRYGGASLANSLDVINETIDYLRSNGVDCDDLNGYDLEKKLFVVQVNGRKLNLCDTCVKHHKPEQIEKEYFSPATGHDVDDPNSTSLSMFLWMMDKYPNYCQTCKSNLFILKHKLYDI